MALYLTPSRYGSYSSDSSKESNYVAVFKREIGRTALFEVLRPRQFFVNLIDLVSDMFKRFHKLIVSTLLVWQRTNCYLSCFTARNRSFTVLAFFLASSNSLSVSFRRSVTVLSLSTAFIFGAICSS